MEIIRKTYKSIYLWFLAFNVFLATNPYFLWDAFSFHKLLFIINFPLAFYFFTKNIKINNIFFFFLFFLLAVYWSLPGENGEFNFSMAVFFVLILMLMDSQSRADTFNNFSVLFAYSMLPGLIIYLLFIAGLSPEPEKVVREHLGMFISYDKYFFSLFSHDWDPIGLITFPRFSGIWDEPGYVGTISAFLLIADKVNLRKKRNIFLLLGGIISYSLAFYVLIGLYFFLNYSMDVIRWIFHFRLKQFVIIFLVFGSFISFTYTPHYNIFLSRRITLEEGKFIAGNNRESMAFQSAYNEFLQKKILTTFFGLGSNAFLKVTAGDSTYKSMIYDKGYFGFFISITLMISYGLITSRKKESILFSFLFVLSWYQRPALFSLVYLLVYFGGLSNLKQLYRLKNTNSFSLHRSFYYKPLIVQA